VLSRKKARNIATAVDDMGVDLHKSRGHGQNINRMPIRKIRTSYKNLRQANTVVNQYLNTYRTFTANTDWNMTYNQTKSSHM